MSIHNRSNLDFDLFPFLYGQRIHPTWQVDQNSVVMPSSPVIVPWETYSPEFGRFCDSWAPAQRPTNGIMTYYGTRPIPQVPNAAYALQWRCRAHKYLKEQMPHGN